MRPLLILGILCVLPLAGCVGDPSPGGDAKGVEASGGPSASGAAGEAMAPGGPRNASLDAPPEWRLGDWWKYTLQDHFVGNKYEVTRVVAGMEPSSYLVGMPRDAFSHDIMVLHLPGMGQVFRSNLSFEIHDALFTPLQFPLTDGKSWPTAFEGRAVTAVVHVEGPTTARIQMDGAGGDHWNLTYDATVGEIVKMANPAYATVEIVDHGSNYTGIVTVPHQHDLIFQHGRIGVALGPNLQPDPEASDVVKVDSTYDRVSFALLLGAIANPGVANPYGYYKETATAPDGKVYTADLNPSESVQFKIRVFGHDKPGGDWKFEHVAGGPGFALAEGIAYHVYDVELPSGKVLPSTGEHHHGG